MRHCRSQYRRYRQSDEAVGEERQGECHERRLRRLRELRPEPGHVREEDAPGHRGCDPEHGDRQREERAEYGYLPGIALGRHAVIALSDMPGRVVADERAEQIGNVEQGIPHHIAETEVPRRSLVGDPGERMEEPPAPPQREKRKGENQDRDDQYDEELHDIGDHDRPEPPRARVDQEHDSGHDHRYLEPAQRDEPDRNGEAHDPQGGGDENAEDIDPQPEPHHRRDN